MQCCTKFQSIWRTSVCGIKLAQKYEWLKFWKNKHQNTTFQSIWRTSGFGTKFAWTNMNDKKIEKINNKIYLCTKFQSIWRTSHFQTKFARKNMNEKNFEKINVKFKINIYNVALDQISFNLANVCFCGNKFSQRKHEWQKLWNNKH